MPKRKYGVEEIVAKLRQVDVLLGQGKTVGEAVKSIGVTETVLPLAQQVRRQQIQRRQGLAPLRRVL